MAKTRPNPSITSKKHLARLERERRQTLTIRYTAIVVVMTVILTIAYGFLDMKILQPRQPVAKVGDAVITTREFQYRVRLERQRLINQYIQNLQLEQLFGYDTKSQNQQIETQLSSLTTLGQSVLDALIEERLIRQEAAQRDIVVKSEDLEKQIKALFNYFPNGTPTPTITPTPVVFSTLSPEQLLLVTITPTATRPPTFTPEPTSTPDTVATPTVVTSPTSTLAPTPTPTLFTLEGYQEEYAKTLEQYKRFGIGESDFRVLIETNLHREKLFDIITADVFAEQEQVWARHILVVDELTAQAVRARLLKGEDFAAVATEVSLDTGTKDNGGDLGWFGKGVMDPVFEQAAFELKIGEISNPVQTSFGYHVIQVLGHENRSLTASEYRQARDEKFMEWLAEIRQRTDIKTFDYWTDRVPTDPDLQTALNTFNEGQAGQ